jgi:hypothetical protein
VAFSSTRNGLRPAPFSRARDYVLLNRGPGVSPRHCRGNPSTSRWQRRPDGVTSDGQAGSVGRGSRREPAGRPTPLASWPLDGLPPGGRRTHGAYGRQHLGGDLTSSGAAQYRGSVLFFDLQFSIPNSILSNEY